VGVRPQYPVDLAKHSIEVIDQGEGPYRHGDVDLISADEREFGGASFVELDGDRRLLGKGSGGEELSGIGVGRNDPCTACGKTDGGVAAATTKVENPSTASIADQPSVDVVIETGTELDIVERSVARGSWVVAGHVRSVWPH